MEKVIEDLRIPFPLCCLGELNCPPEDVGSISGFYEFLKIIKNPKHPEYKHLNEWIIEKDVALGGKYDSNKFHIERVNMLLMNIDLYIEDWEDESRQ